MVLRPKVRKNRKIVSGTKKFNAFTIEPFPFGSLTGQAAIWPADFVQAFLTDFFAFIFVLFVIFYISIIYEGEGSQFKKIYKHALSGMHLPARLYISRKDPFIIKKQPINMTENVLSYD